MVTIEEIPDEVWEFVFSKLTLTDRKNVRLVNKHWMEICNSARITKHEIINLESKDLLQFNTNKSHLKIDIYLRVEDDEVSLEQHNQFWMKHGHSVRFLTVGNIHLHDRMLTKIMDHCPNVVDLTLWFDFNAADDNIYDHDIVESVCTKFDCLMSLTLQYKAPLSFLSGAEFTRLTDCVPNLKSFALNNFAHLKTAMLIIEKQAFTLTELFIENCGFATDIFVEDILKTIGPQLASLLLVTVPLQSIDFLSKYADKLYNLKYFGLNYVPKEGRHALSALIHLTNIEYLSLMGMKLSKVDFTPLARLENLKSLDISFTFCKADGVLALFGAKVFFNLIELKMANLVCVNDDVLAAILPNLPNLKILTLSMCFDISSIAVQKIINNCKQLTHLDLSSCFKIKGVMDPVSINNLMELVYLSLSGTELDPSNVLKFRFKKLETIGLHGISMSEEEVKELMKNCPKLNKFL